MRAGVLIYHPKLNSILTIYRYKNGQHYYVLSGGQIEKSESPIEAAIREIKEEVVFKRNSYKIVVRDFTKKENHGRICVFEKE